jgi:hypothetical protein
LARRWHALGVPADGGALQQRSLVDVSQEASAEQRGEIAKRDATPRAALRSLQQRARRMNSLAQNRTRNPNQGAGDMHIIHVEKHEHIFLVFSKNILRYHCLSTARSERYV